MVLVVANFVPNANLHHHPHAIHLSFWSPFFCFRFFFQCQRFWFSKQNFGCFVLTRNHKISCWDLEIKASENNKNIDLICLLFYLFSKACSYFHFSGPVGEKNKGQPMVSFREKVGWAYHFWKLASPGPTYFSAPFVDDVVRSAYDMYGNEYLRSKAPESILINWFIEGDFIECFSGALKNGPHHSEFKVKCLCSWRHVTVWNIYYIYYLYSKYGC